MIDVRDSRRRAVVGAVAIVCGVLGYFAVGEVVYYWKEHVHHYESGAISALLALRTIQENYKADHGSYAADFARLGLPLGAELSGDLLNWGGPYRYRMGCIVRSQTGSVLEYCIQARPITYSRDSKKSYLVDQTGKMHFTSVNRAAVLHDPPVPTER